MKPPHKNSVHSGNSGSDGRRLAYGIAGLVTLFAIPKLWALSISLYQHFIVANYGDDYAIALFLIAVLCGAICFFTVVVIFTSGVRMVLAGIGKFFAAIGLLILAVATPRPKQLRDREPEFEDW